MSGHKFSVGQMVLLFPSSFAIYTPGENYEIVRLLPSDTEGHQYRIKSAVDGHERVAGENQLSRYNRRPAAEALAQSLYEASDRSGTSWARRGKNIRDAWIAEASKRLV